MSGNSIVSVSDIAQEVWDLAQSLNTVAAMGHTARVVSPAELGNRVGTCLPESPTIRVPCCGHELADELADVGESTIFCFLGFYDVDLTCRADALVSLLCRVMRLSARSESERIAAVNALMHRLEWLAGELLDEQEKAGLLPGSEQRAQLAEAEKQEQELTREDVRE